MNDNALMNKAADNIRILSASMVEKLNRTPGGPMGGADFINVLYSEFLEYDPKTLIGRVATVFPRCRAHVAHVLFGVMSEW